MCCQRMQRLAFVDALLSPPNGAVLSGALNDALLSVALVSGAVFTGVVLTGAVCIFRE